MVLVMMLHILSTRGYSPPSLYVWLERHKHNNQLMPVEHKGVIHNLL